MSQQIFETYQTCPYTGLRSFTEEESIYFKGRDEDIDLATAQLQRNKFLMLTGASGDGKSSLIYAGIIPNARAGFLKSQYSRWRVADFRPERTPFENLCQVVARELKIDSVESVLAELGHGFSALADLYKNSIRYTDTESIAWQEADNTQRAAIKREASNLLILVDQFEEFFTNPENYRQGAPSKDASLVLNLLLETARIALDENLPIYIVFTMRSDYIGQCAAFRGLPEYLGFSQYFVPRLNRTQLQQVIEEPAILNANSITRRLTERLIHDVTEGVDQLPILQHALNQIWIAAENGTEELDLIHYAMVGGLHYRELPDDQQPRFENWFKELPAVIRNCYHVPGLQNVLDTHCNKLYEQAAEYYQNKRKTPVAEADAKAIIKVVFTCLTKIDQGRAVRNRMTLKEITDIAANPRYDAETIAAVIDIFREPGNTFIHPFISSEHPEHNELQRDQILDITHESLIRNWQYLGLWAKEEFDHYSVSKDFEQQLRRWVESNKSQDFLLSIGQLNYFESWFLRVKPNIYWINRYLKERGFRSANLDQAKTTLSESKEFLTRSASKYALTRKLMKIGAKRIAAIMAGIAFLFLSSFMITGFYKKRNSYVLESVHKDVLRLADDPKIGLGERAAVLIEELKLGQTSLDEILGTVQDPVQRIHLFNGIAVTLALQSKTAPPQEMYRSLHITDSLLNLVVIAENDGPKLGRLLKEIADLRVGIEFAYYYNPQPALDSLRKRNGRRSAEFIKYIFEKQPSDFSEINQLNVNLENALNQKALSVAEIKSLLTLLSPFENGLQSDWLKQKYSRANMMLRGSMEYGFQFNGLYQELAYLYAAAGNTDQVSKCVDSLLAYSQNNYLGNYASNADNINHVIFILYNYGHLSGIDVLADIYCRKKKISQEELYARLIGNAIPTNETAFNIELYFWGNVTENISVKFLRRETLLFFFNKYRLVVRSAFSSGDEQNFYLAQSFKNEGLIKSANFEEKIPGELPEAACFDSSYFYYRNTGAGYLNEVINMIGSNASEGIRSPRKVLYLYPDIRLPFHPQEPRNFYHFDLSPVFLEWLLDKKVFESIYTNTEEVSQVSEWLMGYNSKQFAETYFMTLPVKYATWQKLAAALNQMPYAARTDFNLLYLYGGRDAMIAGDTAGMISMYQKIIPQNLLNILRAKEYGGRVSNHSFNMIGIAVKNLYETGRQTTADRIISTFKNPINRSSFYAFTAYLLYREKNPGHLAETMIDSARQELLRADITVQFQPNREIIAAALALKPDTKNIDEAFRLIKNAPARFYANEYICDGIAWNGKLEMARSHFPELISDADLSFYYASMLYNYQLTNGKEKPDWNGYNANYIQSAFLELRYVDESN